MTRVTLVCAAGLIAGTVPTMAATGRWRRAGQRDRAGGIARDDDQVRMKPFRQFDEEVAHARDERSLLLGAVREVRIVGDVEQAGGRAVRRRCSRNTLSPPTPESRRPQSPSIHQQL